MNSIVDTKPDTMDATKLDLGKDNSINMENKVFPESKLDIVSTIINKKIEPNNNIGVFDIITARAFASIDKITKLTKTNRNKDTEYLLLKGKNKTIQEELTDIDKNLYLYEIIKLDTKTHERNMVLIKNNE